MTRPHGHPLGSVAATLALSDWERRTALAAPDDDPDETEEGDPGADLPEHLRDDGGTMSHLDEIEALLAETTGWLEWISPKATTEIAVVFPDGSVYLPTGGTEEEFAFSNAQGKVRRLVRAEDVAPLVKFAREVERMHQPRLVICLNPTHGDGCDGKVCDPCDVAWPCPTAAAVQRLGGA